MWRSEKAGDSSIWYDAIVSRKSIISVHAHTWTIMSTKTITITLEAYKRLRSKKASNESFTDIILKLTRKKDTLAYIRSMKPSIELADNIEKAMRKTRKEKRRE